MSPGTIESPSAKLFEILESRTQGEVREVVLALKSYVLVLEGQVARYSVRWKDWKKFNAEDATDAEGERY